MSLGERLKQLRRGTSQAAFGALLGVSQPTIRNYENNERLPDSGFIKTVCDKLNVTADWLIFGTEQKEKTSNVGGFPEEEKIQHIDIAESHRKKTSNVGGFDPIPLYEEMRTLEKELRQALRENADLRIEVERLKAALTAKEFPTAALPPSVHGAPSSAPSAHSTDQRSE